MANTRNIAQNGAGGAKWGVSVGGMVCVALLTLGVSACSSPEMVQPAPGEESEGEWVQRNGDCVLEAGEGPVRRVINHTDPELCGIKKRNRPADYVRVRPVQR